MEKILLIGARGYLGSHLVKHKPADIELVLSAPDQKHLPPQYPFVAIDIRNKPEVMEAIREHRPDLVINCAANSLPDDAEEQKEWTYEVNVKGVQNIVTACESYGSKLIHISTDYVFKGIKGNHVETEPMEPINYYGETKRDAELIVQKSQIPYLILRTSYLYGLKEPHQRRNVFHSVYQPLKEGKPIYVTDRTGNPTLVDNLALAIYELKTFRESDIIHVANPEQISRIDYAKKVARVFKLDTALIKIIPTKEGWLATRPTNSSLNVDKLNEKYGIRFPPVEANLEWLKIQLE